jgi:hypothetical protein
MKNKKIKIFCITHKPLAEISNLGLIPFGVGKNEYPKNFLTETSGKNISSKNPYYGETTFHYWFWKNKLREDIEEGEWFGMCQYRRYFVKIENRNKILNSNGHQGFMKDLNNINQLKNILQLEANEQWKEYDVILCDPWSVEVEKFSKLFKKAKLELIKDPFLFFKKKKHNIRLHFNMYHGKFFLDKAISFLPQEDQESFLQYLTINTKLKGHCIFYSNKKKLVEKFYQNLFNWLFKCEKYFGISNLTGYGQQRIYSFLTERYMPYWFEKNSKVLTWPWVYYDISKNNY